MNRLKMCFFMLAMALPFHSFADAAKAAQYRAMAEQMRSMGQHEQAKTFDKWADDEEAKLSGGSSAATRAKPNYFKELGKASWANDCPGGDMQIITMCGNANMQYIQYIELIGTPQADKAYSAHKAAAETTVKFHERTRTR